MRLRTSKGIRDGLLPPVLVLAAVLVTACGADFDPPSYLNSVRTLALEATPLEAVGDEEVAVRARVFVPPERRVVREAWTFCPLTMGAQAGFACVFEGCETPLAPDAEGRVHVRPLAAAMECLAAVAAGEGDTDGGGATAAALDEPPVAWEALVRHVVEDDEGLVRESVLRLPVWREGGPTTRNRAPAILVVEADGEPLADDATLPAVAPKTGRVELRVAVDPARLDTYEDAAGDEVEEVPIVTFFATAGRFDPPRDAGAEVTTTWKAKALEEGEDEAAIWVLVSDLRGGQTLRGPFRVAIR